MLLAASYALSSFLLFLPLYPLFPALSLRPCSHITDPRYKVLDR